MSKGIFIRFPCVQVPKKIEYIKNQNFMLDWFGEKRSLIVSEITHISLIILTNELGRAVLTGFGQVSKTKEIFEYILKFHQKN